MLIVPTKYQFILPLTGSRPAVTRGRSKLVSGTGSHFLLLILAKKSPDLFVFFFGSVHLSKYYLFGKKKKK